MALKAPSNVAENKSTQSRSTNSHPQSEVCLRSRKKLLRRPSSSKVQIETASESSRQPTPIQSTKAPEPINQSPRPLKRRRDQEEEPRPKLLEQHPSESRGIHAWARLTQANLELLQESMPGSSQEMSTRSAQDTTTRSGKDSAPHRRVSELSSSKRSRSAAENSTEKSGPNRSYAPNSPRFEKCLQECNVVIEETEEPDQEDLDTLLGVLTKERDSPEPEVQLFHQTRAQVASKNEMSVVKR